MHQGFFPAGRPPASKEPPDLLRATIVFAVSALDTYFHDKILENVAVVIEKCGKTRSGLPGSLSDILKPILTPEKAICLLYRKRPDMEFRKAIAAHISDRTYQDAGKIENGLKLIGITDIWEDLRIALHVRKKDQAKRYLQPYVKRRNQIVHEADLYKSYRSHHKPRSISRKFTRQCVDDTDKFVEKLEKNKQSLVSRLSCRDVKFQVYIKDGKAALKATPVK